MSTDNKYKVLIVGGGVGGMSAAMAMSRKGVDVDLIDIDPDWKAVGAGITITGPTLRAFHELGVYEDIQDVAYVGQDIQVCDVDGNYIRRLETPMMPNSPTEGSGGVMRPTLHKILSEHTLQTGVNVRLSLTVDKLDQDDAGVDVTFSDSSKGRYDMVVGADGVFSKVRSLIFPSAPKPEYTGQSAWRIVAKRPKEIDCRHYFLGGPHKVGLTPTSDDEMYMFLLERTPREWREQDELHDGLKELLAEYGGIIGELRDSITPETDINFRPLEAFHLPAPWNVGRVILIGDAAHPTTPQLASGAGIAVEDAIVLAEELDAAGSVSEAMDRFMTRREPRCRLVVESSIRIGELEQARAPVEEQTAVVQNALAKLKEPI